MSAIEKWNAVRPEANNIMPRMAKIADAAIAELEAENAKLRKFNAWAVKVELEAENERLKVCGSCDEWHPSGHRCYMGDDGTVFTDRMDSCHFDPSRWNERKSASIAVTPTPLSGVAP